MVGRREAFPGPCAPVAKRLVGSRRPNNMRRFSILRVKCESCRKLQEPKGWAGRCPGCSSASFRVVIERAASGWESFDLEDFMPRPEYAALLDDPAERYWRTRSFLQCGGVSGEEIEEFRSAPMETRRRMYVTWKRRELEATMTSDRRVCERCRVIYKVYENRWNQSGYCSQSCGNAAAKAKRVSKG